MSDTVLQPMPPWSPLLSIWLSPRRTIARLTTERPHPLILPLAVLGGFGAAINVLLSLGGADTLLNWRVLLACLVLGGIVGIIELYVLAALASWAARRMGGQPTAPAMRAAFAFSAGPVILGLVLILTVVFGLHASGHDDLLASPRIGLQIRILAVACGLWELVMTVLMLAEAAGVGLWRGVLIYAVMAYLVPKLVTLVVRTFLVQPFNVPATSMMPTLLVGDHVFVAKYAYGYSRHSLPFAPPLIAGRVMGTMPARGDVVVFRLPKDEDVDYVKRVVGLPGDRIKMQDGVLRINGEPVPRERLPDIAGSGACGEAGGNARRWRETLPGGASYETLDCIDGSFLDTTNETTVPPGHLYVLGDNRDNSTDSRLTSKFGTVPLENLIGRFGMIYYSLQSGEGASSLSRIRTERIGTMVR